MLELYSLVGSTHLTKILINYLKNILGVEQYELTAGKQDYERFIKELESAEKQISLGKSSKLELEKVLGNLEQQLPKELSEKIESDFTEVAYANLKQIQEERLRQARTSFNVALILMIIGILIIFAGIVLVFLEKTSTGIITLIVGAVTNAISALTFRFSKEANDRLDKVNHDLRVIEKTRWASKMIDGISDSKVKDKAKAQLAETLRSENI